MLNTADIKEYVKKALKMMNGAVPGSIEQNLHDALLDEAKRVEEELRIMQSQEDTGSEKKVHAKMEEFMKALREDEAVQKAADNEGVRFVTESRCPGHCSCL